MANETSEAAAGDMHRRVIGGRAEAFVQVPGTRTAGSVWLLKKARMRW